MGESTLARMPGEDGRRGQNLIGFFSLDSKLEEPIKIQVDREENLRL